MLLLCEYQRPTPAGEVLRTVLFVILQKLELKKKTPPSSDACEFPEIVKFFSTTPSATISTADRARPPSIIVVILSCPVRVSVLLIVKFSWEIPGLTKIPLSAGRALTVSWMGGY